MPSEGSVVLQTETGSCLIVGLPGAWAMKPGCATLPFFGVNPVLVDEKVSCSIPHPHTWSEQLRRDSVLCKKFPLAFPRESKRLLLLWAYDLAVSRAQRRGACWSLCVLCWWRLGMLRTGASVSGTNGCSRSALKCEGCRASGYLKGLGKGFWPSSSHGQA